MRETVPGVRIPLSPPIFTFAQNGRMWSVASRHRMPRTHYAPLFFQVARLADLFLNTVVKIESGVNKNPTIDTLSKIAKVLEVWVDDLIQK